LLAFQGGRRIAGQKAALQQDINLAWNEINAAEQANPDVAIEVGDGMFRPSTLRAMGYLLSGELEIIGGSATAARDSLTKSLELIETPHAHYFLGILYESEYKPQEALPHFERCLELDPDGELSVSA